jgi:hypothetical protein
MVLTVAGKVVLDVISVNVKEILSWFAGEGGFPVCPGHLICNFCAT